MLEVGTRMTSRARLKVARGSIVTAIRWPTSCYRCSCYRQLVMLLLMTEATIDKTNRGEQDA